GRYFIPLDRSAHRSPVLGRPPPLAPVAMRVVRVAEQDRVDSTVPAAGADVAWEPAVRVVRHGNLPRRTPETEGDLHLSMKVSLQIDDRLFPAKEVVGKDEAASGHG